MLQNHKVNSLLAAILFFLLVMFTSSVFRFLLGAVVLFSTLLLWYNYYYLKLNNVFTIWAEVRVLFLLAAALSLYLIVPNNFLKTIFLLSAAVVIYVVEVNVRIFSEQIILMETLLAYFGFSMGIFAASFYFLPQNTLMLLTLGVGTFFASRASLDYIPQDAQKKNFFSLLIALSIIEIGWALLLLPLHFTALAVILFNFFYVLWIIVYYHLFNNLNAKKITFHIVLSSLIILVVLLSTPWKI